MPRRTKVIPGPSRLSKILQTLNEQPKLHLQALKSLKLTYASRNDHFGARHFAKESLPRIRYANPMLTIEVNKIPKSPSDNWKPELTLDFRDGSTKVLDMNGKWSTTIFQELMDTAGGPSWERWKAERTAAGLPIIGEAVVKTPILEPERPKTGAAAVLP